MENYIQDMHIVYLELLQLTQLMEGKWNLWKSEIPTLPNNTKVIGAITQATLTAGSGQTTTEDKPERWVKMMEFSSFQLNDMSEPLVVWT